MKIIIDEALLLQFSHMYHVYIQKTFSLQLRCIKKVNVLIHVYSDPKSEELCLYLTKSVSIVFFCLYSSKHYNIITSMHKSKTHTASMVSHTT